MSWRYRRKGIKRAEDVRWIEGHSFPQWIRRRLVRDGLMRVVPGRSTSVYQRCVEGVDVVMRCERLQEGFADGLPLLPALALAGCSE